MDPTDNLPTTSGVKRKASISIATAADSSEDNHNISNALVPITANDSNDREVKRKRKDETINNWIEFATEIRQRIDFQQATDQSAAPIMPILASSVSYQLQNCSKMLERMNKFIKDMDIHKHQNITDGYIIINNITKERFAYPWNLGITVGKLEEYFNVTGHAFAVDLKKTYTFQLAFDLDCIECKKSKQQCSQIISASAISTILDDIVKILFEYLPIQEKHELLEHQVIFKAVDSCNLHIYFDLSISIILYNELIDMLMANLPAPITDKYLIDKVSSLPLPYSAKIDGKPYTPLIREPNYQSIVVSSKQQFYEMPLYVTTLLDYSVFKILGTFQQANINEAVNEWSDVSESNKHLSVKLSENCKLKMGIDHQIHSLKNTNIKFNASTNKNLEMYINESQNKFSLRQYFVDSKEINDTVASNKLNRIVIREMMTISSKIAKLTYNVKTLDDKEVYNYLIMFLTHNSCSYSYYGIMTICSHIVRNILNEDQVNENTAKMAVIDFLLSIIGSINKFQEKEQLIHILTVVGQYDIMGEFKRTCPRPSEWFAEISKCIRLDICKNDVYEYLITTILSDLQEPKNLEYFLQMFLRTSQPMFRMALDSSIYFLYVHGLYLEHKENDILNKTSVQTRFIFMQLNKTLEYLTRDGRIALDDKKSKEAIDLAWFNYIRKAKCSKEQFNMYQYYLDTNMCSTTSCGVFNTITGTYMHSTPLLYFRTRKEYCTTTLQDIRDVNELNMTLLHNYDIQKYILRKVIQKQTTFYYLGVLVPGLLLMEDTLYQDSTVCVDIINSLNTFIVNDKDEIVNANNLHYMLPVVMHYNFNLDTVMQICYLLIETLRRGGIARISDMSNTFDLLNKDLSKITLPKLSEFNRNIESKPKQFISEMLRVYGENQFTANLFTVTYAICVIDYFEANSFLRNELNLEKDPEPYMKITSEYIHVDVGGSGTYESNIILKPFDETKFRVASHLNFQRVYATLFTEDTLSRQTPEFLAVLTSYSVIFNFRSDVLDDFFKFLSMIYCPGTKRKFLTLMIGPPKSGKTMLQTLMHHANKTSSFSTNTIFNQSQSSSSASPDMIQMFSNYLCIIAEVRRMDTETLKSITGGDNMNKRGLYQSEHRTLYPITFVLGAANQTPTMYMADEAIRERLAIFETDNTYIKMVDLGVKYEDNPLLMHMGHLTIATPHMIEENLAKELSNILYIQYMLKRNTLAIVEPSVQNHMSLAATKRFLISNNYIYELFEQSGIIFHPDLQITVNEIKALVAEEIVAYNEKRDKRNVVKLSWTKMKAEMLLLFKSYMLSDGVTFSGFGVKTSNLENNFDIIAIMKPQENCCVKMIELRRYLQNVKKIGSSFITSKVQKCLEMYADNYDDKLKVFKNMKLVV